MQRPRILAIDDEKFFRTLYSDILSHENYDVRTAGSGEEGIRIFESESFDIVITDMAMRGIDGLHTMEVIKRINPDQDVIIITGIGDVQLAVNAMKKGVTDYILKPVDPDDLIQTVKTVLEKQNLRNEHSKLISENIEYFGILSVYQRCLRILSILELEKLLDMILESVMAETNAQGSVVWLLSSENGAEMNISSARGMVNLSHEPEVIHTLNDANAGLMSSGKPYFEMMPGGPDENKSVFFVPLKTDKKTLALIKVSDKSDRAQFEVRDLMIAKTIAGFASIAVGNAMKVRDMSTRGLKDPLTNAYHLNYFTDYVSKEVSKARRYQRSFSIIYLRIENYQELIRNFSESELNDTIMVIINIMLGVIRDADIHTRVRNDEYYILLPETDYFGSLMSVRRLNRALKGKVFVSNAAGSAAIETGISSASFPKDGDNLAGLINILKKRLSDNKKSIYVRSRLGDMDFWGIFDTVCVMDSNLPVVEYPGHTASGKFRRELQDGRLPDDGSVRLMQISRSMLNRLFDIIISEIEINVDMRGILYMGGGDMSGLLAHIRRRPKLDNSSTKIFVFGNEGEKDWDMPSVTPVVVEDHRIEHAHFLFFLSIEYAYGIMMKEGDDGVLYGLHTSDAGFVENMIAKAQENYHLQVQL